MEETMTEKEKMLAGLPYDASCDELKQDRIKAKDLLYAYEQYLPSQRKERRELLKTLLHTKDHFQIESPFACDYGYNIRIGEDFYANHNCVMLDCATITIGDHVLFGPNVALYTAGHPIHHETRRTGLEFALPITIGDDVWIGGSVVINPGVTIGARSIIGSGSVVNRDIPEDVIALGNPIHILRKITEEDRSYYYKGQAF